MNTCPVFIDNQRDIENDINIWLLFFHILDQPCEKLSEMPAYKRTFTLCTCQYVADHDGKVIRGERTQQPSQINLKGIDEQKAPA